MTPVHNEKPWIERITALQLKQQYGHLTINSVNKDVDSATDLFRMLNIGARPIPSHDDNLDCLAFPSIFPYGEGGRSAQRTPLNEATYEKAHVLSADA